MKASHPVIKHNKESHKLKILLEETRHIMNTINTQRQAFYDAYRPGDKKEFINGGIIESAPKLKHTIFLKNLLNILRVYSEKHLSGIVLEDALVSLTHNDYVPDICFFSNARAAGLSKGQVHYPAPDFAVEILSNASEIIDKEIKLNDYELHGVTEYWIIAPDDQEVFQYTLHPETKRYHLVERLDDTLVCQSLPGLNIPIEAIFDGGLNLSFLHELMEN